MKCQFNVKGNQKICAFCKYWYDPTNSAISPKNPYMGIWEYDREATSKCLIHKSPTKCPAHSSGCSDYVCKIPK